MVRDQPLRDRDPSTMYHAPEDDFLCARCVYRRKSNDTLHCMHDPLPAGTLPGGEVHWNGYCDFWEACME